jgi:hypothetical protein
MKPLFSLLALMVAYSFSFATVRTVCNMPYSPGQFTNFTDAMNASNSNDTIYVHGSSINYGSVYINRPLVIIGTGHNPGKQNPLVSSFLDISVGANAVQLIGLHVRRIDTYGTIGCVVKKCKITGDGSNNLLYLLATFEWLVEGNIMELTSGPSEAIHFGNSASHNTIIQNNVFISPSTKIFGLVNGASERTYFLNNVFLGHTGLEFTFANVQYCNIENNIFYQSIPDGGGGFLQNSTMNNNISYFSSNDTFYQPGANNLATINPLFVNYPGPQMIYDYAWDLSLLASSPGHNTGTDGTDRGVFGGLGFKFTETGEPPIAEITAFTITSPTTIAPGGTLTISVTSKRVP